MNSIIVRHKAISICGDDSSDRYVFGVLPRVDIIPGSVYVEIFESDEVMIPYLSVSFDDNGRPDVVLSGKKGENLVVDSMTNYNVTSGVVRVSVIGGMFSVGSVACVNYEFNSGEL